MKNINIAQLSLDVITSVNSCLDVESSNKHRDEYTKSLQALLNSIELTTLDDLQISKDYEFSGYDIGFAVNLSNTVNDVIRFSNKPSRIAEYNEAINNVISIAEVMLDMYM